MNKPITIICFYIVLSLGIFSSCDKENNASSSDEIKSITLRSVITSPGENTKTSHSFIDNKLKTIWNTEDTLLVTSNDKIFRDKGPYTTLNNKAKFAISKLEDNGKTALFSLEKNWSVIIEDISVEYDLYARYPHKDVDLSEQTGELGDLNKYDVLEATGKIKGNETVTLNFSPVCIVMRLPVGTKIYADAYSGKLDITLSGDNVLNKLNSTTIGDVNIKSTKNIVQNGILTEDVYISFIPKNLTGEFNYLLKTGSGDEYVFKRNSLNTSTIYKLDIYPIKAVVFEDNTFKDFCIENYDKNKDGIVTVSEVNEISEVNVSNKSIKSLKGIEWFANLEILDCSKNSLTTLNLKSNDKLKSLKCYSNQLTSLDLSNCAALTTLNCRSNQLKSLDLGSCTVLTTLNCHSNNLSSLYVGKCTVLTTIDCHSNVLSGLQLKQLPYLIKLDCSSNIFTSIDVGGHTSLKELDCSDNTYSLTSLNVKGCTALTKLSSAQNNSLEELDVSGCTALTYLVCSANLSSLNLTGCSALEELICQSNKFTSLNLSDCSALKKIMCDTGQLTSLDVSKNAKLTYLMAWPQSTLTYLYVKKGQIITYYLNMNYTKINPADWGTTVIEVD